MKIEEYIAQLRQRREKAASAKRSPAKGSRQPQPRSARDALGMRFVEWATAAHISPIIIPGAPSASKRRFGKNANGWLLAKQTYKTDHADFQYQQTFTAYYAVTITGEIAWFSNTPNYSYWPIELPELNSQEDPETTKKLIARFIVNSGSSVPWPG